MPARRRLCALPCVSGGACRAASSPAPMTPNLSAPLLSTVLDALGRAGAPGREIAPRLDLMRSIGPGYAWREHRRRQASAPSDGRRAGYLALWSDAARQIGAQATDLSSGFVELHRGGARVVVWNHWVPLDDVVSLKLALAEPLVHQILTAGGLPVPEHALFHVDDLSAALEFLERHDAPCVVKPVDREGGALTTSGSADRRTSASSAPAGAKALTSPSHRAPGSRRELPLPVPRRAAVGRGAPSRAAGVR